MDYKELIELLSVRAYIRGDELCEDAATAIETMLAERETSVSVVKCSNCKHLYFKDFSGFCPHMVGPCAPDGFCSYGERRKSEAIP